MQPQGLVTLLQKPTLAASSFQDAGITARLIQKKAGLANNREVFGYIRVMNSDEYDHRDDQDRMVQWSSKLLILFHPGLPERLHHSLGSRVARSQRPCQIANLQGLKQLPKMTPVSFPPVMVNKPLFSLPRKNRMIFLSQSW